MLIVLAGGFVVAVIVSVIMVSIMRPGTQPAPVVAEAPKTKLVLTAGKTIKAGDKLSADNTVWREWPEDRVFEGLTIKASDNGESLIKGRVNRAIGPGEPILKSVMLDDSPNLLAASLEKGKRAVALNVNAASTAGGFITPGDMVDVIITFAIRPDRDEKEMTEQVVERFISETVLENVRVLAIDQQSQKPENGAKIGRTVTLEVDNKGARQLMLASQMGELSLALRAMGDEEVLGKGEETVTDITTAKIYGEIARLREDSPVSSRHSVRILNGSGVVSVSPGPATRNSRSLVNDDQLTQSFN